MKIKRFFFLFGILIIFVSCLAVMNENFDRLSRYPYQGEQDRKLIDRYLDDEEIEYIIEYSIAPAFFIDYIECPRFNIYHVDEYHKVQSANWYLNQNEVVDYVEKAMQYEDGIDVVHRLMDSYYYGEVLYWLEYGDSYRKDSEIITNPNSEDAFLDDFHTMSKRIPNDLEVVDELVTTREVSLKRNAHRALSMMCEAIDDSFSGTCGGLVANEGYISYEEQEERFKKAKMADPLHFLETTDYPGHSEHQLGFAVDLGVKGYDNIEDAPQYAWLKEHAYAFGFVQTYTEESIKDTNKAPRPSHFRYVGNYNAEKMHKEQKTFKEILK